MSDSRCRSTTHSRQICVANRRAAARSSIAAQALGRDSSFTRWNRAQAKIRRLHSSASIGSMRPCDSSKASRRSAGSTSSGRSHAARRSIGGIAKICDRWPVYLTLLCCSSGFRQTLSSQRCGQHLEEQLAIQGSKNDRGARLCRDTVHIASAGHRPCCGTACDRGVAPP